MNVGLRCLGVSTVLTNARTKDHHVGAGLLLRMIFVHMEKEGLPMSRDLWEKYDPSAPRPDPQRQQQGKLNKVAGARFEAYIKQACEFYRKHGLADVDKTPEPFHVTGRRQKNRNYNARNKTGGLLFEGYFESPAQPDFQGTIQGGRSIMFEAKTAHGDRVEQKKVTVDQEKALESHSQLGAACFVFVMLNMQDIFRVPWETWRDMKQLYGRKYMTEAELQSFSVSEHNGTILLFDGVKL